MAGSVDNHGDGALLDSWEVSDLDSTINRSILSSKRECNNSSPKLSRNCSDIDSVPVRSSLSGGVLEDMVNSVDQFLREALQNPRERLSVLRIEQDVEKFIKDPVQQQMEFSQLPTSYLRLAAHRVAQHYSLQSTALLDNNLPEGFGSRIIIHKTSECRPPLIRLADIPLKLPTDDSDNNVVKVAIKQRPNKRLQNIGSNSTAQRGNSLKSVDERKEEYNRARARIFNSSSSLEESNMEEVSSSTLVDMNGTWSRSGGNMVDGSISGPRNNSKVAIFRDREVERNDPDYDRSYDRYAQRFDPGFGFNGSSYPVQPIYAPIFTYNTEFPQLGSVHTHRAPSILTEHQPHTLGQPIPGSWVTPSSPAGIGYRPSETMVNPYSLNHAYMQYSSQRSALTFIHPREQVHQQLAQSQQLQPDSTFGLARPR
ncbi:uncharacterized protein [Rutidosis leptorrhynchoides]|uniref:uncharacterized protein n=1 Tax=Rutidosis leptorrhynchoides TaxID=125765 RepID=UPI003A99BD1D